MFALLFSRYLWISRKTNISIKPWPNPKSPNDPWWLCTLSLIWWEMNCKIDLWHINGGNEMKHLSVWELYIFERFFSIWVKKRCCLWCSLEIKCELILISFGSVNFIFVLSFLVVECLKNVVLITLEVYSLQILFIVSGVGILEHFYYCHNLPFKGRARRDRKWRLPKKENAGESPPTFIWGKH